MPQKTKLLQKRYEGFLQTPCLWKDNTVFDLEQFKIDEKSTKINIEIDEKIRLGKYIERLVSFQLSQENSITILCENVQIQKEKRTLGELDCILKQENTVIHLEVIYKFYLFDATVGNSEIEHFIGPNRKDSLLEKLTKLKEKQLPLLYSDECKTYLSSINLESSKIEQQVYFKAQLFLPFSDRKIKFRQLNIDCICGFYIHKNEINQLINNKFYMPNKKDWIVIPHENVNWISYANFLSIAEEYAQKKFSPLCWMKQQNGAVLKIFLVWW